MVHQKPFPEVFLIFSHLVLVKCLNFLPNHPAAVFWWCATYVGMMVNSWLWRKLKLMAMKKNSWLNTWGTHGREENSLQLMAMKKNSWLNSWRTHGHEENSFKFNQPVNSWLSDLKQRKNCSTCNVFNVHQFINFRSLLPSLYQMTAFYFM